MDACTAHLTLFVCRQGALSSDLCLAVYRMVSSCCLVQSDGSDNSLQEVPPRSDIRRRKFETSLAAGQQTCTSPDMEWDVCCRLHTPERLQAARDALAAAEADLQAASTGKALSVAFKGLGHFRHQVLCFKHELHHIFELTLPDSVSQCVMLAARPAMRNVHGRGCL